MRGILWKAVFSAVAHRMLEPAVLHDWTDLFVHYHVLQVLQGWMLAHFILEWQHVFAGRTWRGRQGGGKENITQR